MFGFLNPVRNDTAYRRVYARCCLHQNLNCGLLSLPFLSYESIFLYLCAMDAASCTPCSLPNQVCCRLRTSRTLHHAPDAEIGRFCSAISMILATTKMQDDIRDGRSLKACFYNWLLKKQVRTARLYLSGIDNKFNQRINEFIHRHLEVERAGVSVGLDEYAQPTAEAFGYVFGLMAHIRTVKVDRDTLSELGRRIGTALIAFDCAYDWQRDRTKGEFNPLPDEGAICTAIVYCQDQLRDASQVCRRAFGSECESSKVLVAVKKNIGIREPQTIYSRLHELFQQWGFIRQKGAVQLNTDCGLWCCGICACLCCAAVLGHRDGETVHVYHHNGNC